MAHYSTNNLAFQPITTNPIHRFLAALGNAVTLISISNDRVRQVEALQSLSDEELAERGLRRDEIARHVFNDVFWQ